MVASVSAKLTAIPVHLRIGRGNVRVMRVRQTYISVDFRNSLTSAVEELRVSLPGDF